MDVHRRVKKMHSSLISPTKTYGAHSVDEDDILAVTEVLRGSNLTCGKYVDQFEEDLAKSVNANYAVASSNGTTALHMASIVAGIKPDDYVIVPTLTFLATANAPKYCGANIIFCDVDPENGLLTQNTVLEAIKRSPKKPVALYPVDLAGQPSSSVQIKELCERNGIKIIQDSCHSLGTSYFSEGAEQIIGNNKYSDFTVFSFHPVKNITTGEGGAITTNDEENYIKLKALRSHGMVRDPGIFNNNDLGFNSKHLPNPWYYEMQQLGFNYRLTDIQAALGISQLNKLKKFKEIRKKLKFIYDKALSPYYSMINPINIVPGAEPCWHLYTVLIDFQKLMKDRADVMRALSEKGIGTQVHYIPVHLQPYYKKNSPSPELEGALAYYSKTLSLPLHVHLTETDIHNIVQTVVEILNLK